MIRMSSAAEPSTDSGAQPLAPGIGLKFLRDGVPSANLVAMYQIEGQPDDWNFFSHDFCNHIGAPTSAVQKAGSAKFATVTKWPNAVGLSDWADIDEHGNKTDGVFPFKVCFKPTKEMKNKFSKSLGEGDDAMSWLE